MLVVDLLHEFELGVWKALFTQLIRLLYAAGKGSEEQGSEALVVELDLRFVFKSFDFIVIIHILQIPPNINIWIRYHSNVLPEFVRNEKTCSSRLRRLITGMRVSGSFNFIR